MSNRYHKKKHYTLIKKENYINRVKRNHQMILNSEYCNGNVNNNSIRRLLSMLNDALPSNASEQNFYFTFQALMYNLESKIDAFTIHFMRPTKQLEYYNINRSDIKWNSKKKIFIINVARNTETLIDVIDIDDLGST